MSERAKHRTEISFIVLTHGRIDHLDRLLDRLSWAKAVAVHVDARAHSSVRAAASIVIARHVNALEVESIPCYWGGIGIVKATLNAIDLLDNEALIADRVCLISGQDYPIKSPAEIQAFFEREPDAEYIESFDLASANRWSNMQGRFHAEKRYSQIHLRFRSRVASLPLIRRRGPFKNPPRGGSQWWSLTAGCVKRVRTEVQRRPAVLRFFRHTWIPDEIFFQSMIANSSFQKYVKNTSLTYMIWDRPKPPYPANLRSTDFRAMVESPCLFARKFDDESVELITLIDSQTGGDSQSMGT